MMDNISIRIFGVPQRIDNIRETQKRLSVPDELIFIDKNYEGCVPTARKAWGYPTDKEFTMVLQDDIELCEDFEKYLEIIVRTHPEAIISFYSLKLSNTAIPVGVYPKSPYISTKFASGQAIIMRTEWVEPCLNSWKEWVDGDDVNITNWANDEGKTILTTLPTIVQHLGVQSVFNPSRSLGGSPHYNNKPSHVDWSNGFITPDTNIIRR